MNLIEEMDVWIRKNAASAAHFHEETELDFVIEGSVKATVKDTEFLLKKDDVILFNSGIQHSITSLTENTVICCVKYSSLTLARMSGNEINLFDCCSAKEQGAKYQELRGIFYELIYTQIQKTHRTDCLKQSLLYKLMDALLEQFSLDSDSYAMQHSDDLKLMQIFQYVNQNFAYTVSLAELADKLYLSKSTLSRFFRKQTGIYFADYVNQVRLQHAVEDLVYTDKNMTRIANDSGFSNSSAFNKIFREVYGVTPTEYREKEASRREKSAPVLSEGLKLQIEEKLDLEKKNSDREEITVNLSTAKGEPFPKKWGECINIGSANALLSANLQYHTLYLHERLGFRYIRLWSVFSKKLMLSDGRTKGRYNYDRLDLVLDFLVSNKLIPFLDLANRPDLAVTAPGNDSIFKEEDYIPFVSREIWEDFFCDFIAHIRIRYGTEETGKWIFELGCDSYEPERRYYQDPEYSYFEVFRFAHGVIKEQLPGAEVGGPMAGLKIDYDFIAEFLQYCGKQNCRPDFVSYTLFPYHSVLQDQTLIHERSSSLHIEKKKASLMRKVLADNHAEDCKLYITEWNNSLSNRNALNDSCFRAAYFAKKIAEMADMADMMAVWVGSDWISSYFDTYLIANGGAGLLTKDTIRKPAYFALWFLNEMGTTLIDRGEHYLITRHDNGTHYILCFNYKWFGANYFIRGEELFKDPADLKVMFEDNRALELDINLYDSLPDSEYIIKKWIVNNEGGSILTEWEHFQFESELQGQDVKYIRESCYPRLQMERKQSKNGQLHIQTSLQAHEISLLHIFHAPS